MARALQANDPQVEIGLKPKQKKETLAGEARDAHQDQSGNLYRNPALSRRLILITSKTCVQTSL
jgi:hypothetical protein